MMKLLLALFTIVLTVPAFAQPIELVEDIRPGFSGSSPIQLTKANGLLFFVADDGAHGEELWVMNANEQVTLLDITPGAAGTNPENLMATETHLFFLTSNYDQNDDFESHTVWSSDGTLNGTQALGTFPDGGLGFGVFGMKTTSSLLFFIATHNGQNAQELWRSDGTPAGTFMIDVNNDPTTPSITADVFNPVVYEDELYFYGDYLSAILRSDGTQAGTEVVVNDNIHISGGRKLLVYQDILFYISGSGHLRQHDLNTGGETTIIDAIATGTQPVSLLYGANERLYFKAETVAHGEELWVHNLFSFIRKKATLLKDFTLGSESGSIWGGIEYQESFISVPATMVSMGRWESYL